MAKFKTAIFVGSLRKDSNNLKLAKAITLLGKDKFDAQIVNIGDLPLFNQDLEANVPAQVTRMKSEIAAADGVLFVTAEYNRSVPGALKNAIDWASRPYGQNSFKGKPTALCGASPGGIGSACSQQHLKPILNYLDVELMGAPEVYLQFKEGMIDNDGNITVDGTKKFLQGFVDAYANWVARHSAGAAPVQKAAAG